LKSATSIFRRKTSLLLIIFALIVGGIGAQTIGLLNNSSGELLACINSTTKVVTNPGTSSCPEGSERIDFGAQGADGVSGSKITELSICGSGGTSLCKIGAKGPGGGLIFFVDYNDQSPDFNYLEAAPTDGVFAGNLYWSSSESNATIAWSQFFNGGYQSRNYKDFTGFVRPVRAF
jgi:hypothetical protein